jgi:hypothetical protein
VTTSRPFCKSTQRVDSFHGYSAVFKIKGRISASFSTRVDSLWKRYYEKEESKPYSFAQVSVHKIREMLTKGVSSQNDSVSGPYPLKLCLWIQLERVNSLSWLFPAFLCFEYRLRWIRCCPCSLLRFGPAADLWKGTPHHGELVTVSLALGSHWFGLSATPQPGHRLTYAVQCLYV